MTFPNRLMLNGALVAVSTLAILLPSALHAEPMELPVIERENGNLDTCALGQVTGLKADGDGFLAVRSGPAEDFSKLDELHNGARVWLFDRQGEWVGIVYGVDELSCSPVDADREVPYPGDKGWVHENWIEIIAG